MFCGIFACIMAVPHVHAVTTDTRRGQYFLGTRIADGFKPLCGCWESNWGSLDEESVSLTTGPSFQSLDQHLK